MLSIPCTARGADVGAAIDPPPLNDNLEDAIAVEGPTFVLEADLRSATFQPDEPAFHRSQTSFPPFGGSIWWSWIAPGSGLWSWDASSSANSVFVSIHAMPIAEGSQPIANSFIRPAPLLESHSGALGSLDQVGIFRARQGDRFLIRLTSLVSDGAWTNLWRHVEKIRFGIPPPQLPSYPVAVRFTPVSGPSPLNDAFENRSTLPTLPTKVSIDLSHASPEPVEPRVNQETLGQTVWWSYHAAGYGSLRFSFGTNYSPPVVSVYQVSDSRPQVLVAHSATRRGTDLSACGSCSYSFDAARATLEFDTLPDTEYAIQLDRFPASDVQATLDIEFVRSPVNDLPESATPLVGDDLELQASNLGATWRPGEPRMAGMSGSNSIWYSWSAPSAGIVQVGSQPGIRHLDPGWSGGGVIITATPTWWPSVLLSWTDLHPLPAFVPVFGLYNPWLPSPGIGSDPSALAIGTTNTLLEVSSPTDLLITMDGRENTSGETPFYLLHTPTPSNDHWSNRVRLPSEAGRAEGRTFAATSEPWERALLSVTNEPLRTAWWEWKAPTSGRWAVPMVRDYGWNALVAFRGVEPLVTNRLSPGSEPVLCFDAQAGEVFQIAAYEQRSGSFGSSLIFGIRPVALPELRLITAPPTEWGNPLLELQIGDGPGLPYVIEVSSDLINWQPYWYLFEAQGFSAQAQIDTSQRFYRTRWLASP